MRSIIDLLADRADQLLTDILRAEHKVDAELAPAPGQLREYAGQFTITSSHCL
jgi:hypothetical protein